jgi:PAS domain S-box-containing protein
MMDSKTSVSGQAARVLAIGLLVFALSWISLRLSISWQRLPPIWLPNALTVTFLLKSRLREWPALLMGAFLGNVAAAVSLGDPLGAALGMVGSNVVESALCAGGAMRILGGRVDLARARDIMVFTAIAIGAALCGATFGSSWLGLSNHLPPLTNWLLWAMADALGLIILTPLLCAMHLDEARKPFDRARIWRFARVIGALAVGVGLAAVTPSHSLPLIAPPLLVFATLELEFLGAALGTLAVAVAFTVFVANGWSPLVVAGHSLPFQVLGVQAFLLGTSLVTLPVAATLQRRRGLEQELRASRDALVEANRQARMAEKLAGIGYWRFMPGGDRFHWSEEMYRIYGRDPALGPPTYLESAAMVHRDDVTELERHRNSFGDREAPALSVRIVRPGGEVRHVIVRSMVERDNSGQIVARFGTCSDVTELKEAEAAARSSEARYRFLAENAPDMISRTSLTGEPIYVSPGSLRVLGYTPEEMKSQSALKMVHPDHAERVLNSILWLISSRTSRLPEPLRYRVRHKDGHWIWIETNPILVFDEAGEPIEFIDVVRDVTQTKTFEAELDEARVKAEAAAAAKSAFLANMSHELRTPLTSIIGFSRLLGERPELAEDSRRYARRILDASGALLSVINDVLDFSKLEAGQAQLEIQPLSVARLVDETTGIVAIQAAAKGLTLKTELDARTPELIGGDVGRLRQVLLNFLSNAVKFTQEGGVTVTTRWRGGPRSGKLKVTVADTGDGIAPDKLERLFERFSQTEVSISRTHGGTGLGLAICKATVELMGGKVGVETKPGKGSSFWFEISARAAKPVTAPEEAEGASELPPLNVLMVDDTAVNRELVKLMLEPLGCRIEEATGGADGVQAAMTRSFDLILMDVRMPGVDGLEATKLIRAVSPLNRKTPILALTADVQPENVLACRGAGMDDLIAKPISPAELLAKLAHWSAVGRDEDRAAASA